MELLIDARFLWHYLKSKSCWGRTSCSLDLLVDHRLLYINWQLWFGTHIIRVLILGKNWLQTISSSITFFTQIIILLVGCYRRPLPFSCHNLWIHSFGLTARYLFHLTFIQLIISERWIILATKRCSFPFFFLTIKTRFHFRFTSLYYSSFMISYWCQRFMFWIGDGFFQQQSHSINFEKNGSCDTDFGKFLDLMPDLY